jgi:aldehyde:ferredoxin oxidoreductase
MQGLAPSSAGSLLAWITNCCEKSIFSDTETGNQSCHWGDEESLIRMMDGIIQGRENGNIFRQGSLRASKILGKGEDQVAHAGGWDIPVHGPHSSKDYAFRLSLYPEEWDYFRSLPSSLSPANKEVEMTARAKASEELKVLADITSFCPLVVVHLLSITAFDMAELISIATGTSLDPSKLMASVRNTIQTEKALSNRMDQAEETQGSSLHCL